MLLGVLIYVLGLFMMCGIVLFMPRKRLTTLLSFVATTLMLVGLIIAVTKS